MPGTWALTIASVAAVSLLSLVGALTLAIRSLRRHTVLLALVAFAAGSLLGDAFFHLLPEAVAFRGGLPPSMALLVVLGFGAFFLLENVLRWGHAHGEGAHPHDAAPERVAPFAWTNLVGDGIHNFIDGVLVGAAYLVDVPLGVATTVAVAAHEIPQELGDFAVLLRAGVRPGRALAYNFASALLAVLGAVLVLALPVETDLVEFYSVPLIAGGFLYIAAADLVPELHHHAEARYTPLILAGLAAGVGLMGALLQLEVA